MNSSNRKFLETAALTVALFAGASCSTTPKTPPTSVVVTQAGVPGGLALEAVQTTAKVTALDPAKRRYTLTRADGQVATFTAGPEMVNYDQLKVGDTVKATQTEELAVALRKSSSPPSTGESVQITRAPRGDLPGLFMTRSRDITAAVQAVDAKARTVTLQFLDGKAKKFKLGSSASLGGIQPGDEVVASLTETVTLQVQSP